MHQYNGVKPSSPADWPDVKMYGADFRSELHTIFQVIDELALWEQFQTPFTPIMTIPSTVPPHIAMLMQSGVFVGATPNDLGISKDAHIVQVVTHPRVDADGHSRNTLMHALKVMEALAKLGWDEFYKQYDGKVLGMELFGVKQTRTTTTTVPVDPTAQAQPAP